MGIYFSVREVLEPQQIMSEVIVACRRLPCASIKSIAYPKPSKLELTAFWGVKLSLFCWGYHTIPGHFLWQYDGSSMGFYWSKEQLFVISRNSEQDTMTCTVSIRRIKACDAAPYVVKGYTFDFKLNFPATNWITKVTTSSNSRKY